MRNRAGLLAIVLALLVSWAGSSSAIGLDAVMEKGELLVAVYRDFPPFSYRRDGVLAGVDVDLGAALAERLGVRARFFELTAGETVDDDLRNAVWKGHYLDRRVADVMLHVPTERAYALRQTEAVIFAPYYRERIVVARDPERVGGRDSIEVFTQEKVGVELDSLPDFYLTAALGGSVRANVVHYPTVAGAVDGLIAGEVAAIMATCSEIAARLAERGSDLPVGTMDTPGLSRPGWELGLAVRQDGRDLAWALGDIIAEMRRNGTIAAIFQRHRLPYQAPEE